MPANILELCVVGSIKRVTLFGGAKSTSQTSCKVAFRVVAAISRIDAVKAMP
jgi:hypothetical protein